MRESKLAAADSDPTVRAPNGRLLMYWMLLPLDANAGRHLGDDSAPATGAWTLRFKAAWSRLLQKLASGRG
jgi:hypothetical protein